MATLQQEEGTWIALAVDGKGPLFLWVGGEGKRMSGWNGLQAYTVH